MFPDTTRALVIPTAMILSSSLILVVASTTVNYSKKVHLTRKKLFVIVHVRSFECTASSLCFVIMKYSIVEETLSISHALVVCYV